MKASCFMYPYPPNSASNRGDGVLYCTARETTVLLHGYVKRLSYISRQIKQPFRTCILVLTGLHSQLGEVQDWAAHLEHLQSILLEFDADCAPGEGQLGRTFYDGLRPSYEVGRQRMPSDDLVSAANRAEAKARIHSNHHLDQRCPKGKRPLKMSLANPPQSDQSEATEKARKDINNREFQHFCIKYSERRNLGRSVGKFEHPNLPGSGFFETCKLSW